MSKPSLAQRVKTSAALLARARKDPGLRSKLPDKYLTSDQLKARRRNQALADIGDIGTPLSGQSMVNAAQQLTDSEYAPLLAGVGQQEQIVNKSAGLQGDWAKRYYGDLNGLIGNIGTAQTAANANSVQAAIDQGKAAQGAITQADTDAVKRMADDAAVRGQGLQGTAAADVAARTQTARDNATAAAGQAQTSAQNAGDASAAFLRGLQGTAAQQGGEYQQQITGAQSQALAALAQTRKELDAKRAGSVTDTLLKLRGAEQQNAITAAGLGVRQDAASASADASAGAEGRRYGYTPSEWLSMPASTRTAIVAKAKQTSSKSNVITSGALAGKTDDWVRSHPKEAAALVDAYNKRGGKKGGAGNDRATGAAIEGAQTDSSSALADAKTLYAEGIHDRHKLATMLMHGRGAGETVSVTQKTKDGSVTRKVPVGPDGQPIKDAPAVIDKHKALYTSVALDVLIDGHVSRPNARRLHDLGITVEDLGFPSYTDYQRSHRGGVSNYPTKGGSGAGA